MLIPTDVLSSNYITVMTYKNNDQNIKLTERVPAPVAEPAWTIEALKASVQKLPVKNLDAYLRYLKTTQWETKKAKLIKASGNRCAVCGATEHLQPHHLSYDHVFVESPVPGVDMICICRSCHGSIHGGATGKSSLYDMEAIETQKLMIRVRNNGTFVAHSQSGGASYLLFQMPDGTFFLSKQNAGSKEAEWVVPISEDEAKHYSYDLGHHDGEKLSHNKQSNPNWPSDEPASSPGREDQESSSMNEMSENSEVEEG